MPNIIKDKFILEQSFKKSLNRPGDEIRLDLKLELNRNNFIDGIITGVIKDTDGNLIEGASVKLTSSDYKPIMHTITNSKGEYSLSGIELDKELKIYAIASGKKLSRKEIIVSTISENLKIDFTLEKDPSKDLTVIAGDIFDVNSKNPIKYAIVNLYSVIANKNILIATTDSNKYGQFTFRQVEQGRYNIQTFFEGYKSDTSTVDVLNNNKIIPLKIGLIQNPSNSLGTVSGIIKEDILEYPIENADVILYKIEIDDRLTPIAFTKTNSDGVYLFQDVPKGKYKIKSNKITIETIVSSVSPYYYGFSLVNSSTLIPKYISILEADLDNGANRILEDSFVSSLGGVTGGTMIMRITPPFSGYFDINIKYISGHSDTTIILQENPNNNGQKRTIKFLKTRSWNLEDAKTVTISIPLHSGLNQFKLFNDLNVQSPWIGDFSISYTKYSYNVEQKDGEVKNGAIFVYPLATLLGGPTKGEVTIPIDVPFTQPYNLKIEYSSGDEDRPLKIDVDGENKANFIVEKTNSWSFVDNKIHELNIWLEKGKRKIKFYNDTGEYAPNIGNLVFDEYTTSENFLPKDVLLFNADIKNDITGVEYIDGLSQGTGEIKFSVVVFERQLYDFQIQYRCDVERSCNVKVNDIQVEYENFIFKPTGNSVELFSCQLFLYEGKNIITIYN